MSAAAKAAWPFGDLKMFGYDVAMIDPAWHFDLRSAKGEAKSPQAQYRTMSIAEVAALPVGDLLAPGGILFLWTTWPIVAQGLHAHCIECWGLKGVTGGSWAKRTASGKLRWGPGYVVRSVCEPWIIAGLPDAGVRGPSIKNMIETIEAVSIDGLAREHSRKPDEAYSLLEALSPGARRADVFARTPRAGWDGFGDELNKFGATA